MFMEQCDIYNVYINVTAGCLWDCEEAVQIAKTADAAPNVKFQGLYTHCGNSYSPNDDVRKKVQQDTTERLITLKNRCLYLSYIILLYNKIFSEQEN